MNIPSVESVEFGRRVVQNLRDKYQHLAEASEPQYRERWAFLVKMIDRDMLNSEGCVVTAFDERWLDSEFRFCLWRDLPPAPREPEA